MAYLIGGGIGSLAAAAFLIRDGGMPGSQISIFEAGPVMGGSLDGAGDAERGYSMRGGRMRQGNGRLHLAPSCCRNSAATCALTWRRWPPPTAFPVACPISPACSCRARRATGRCRRHLDTKNFAFVSQFVEIPLDTVFTVEFSVRAAQMAVYQLLDITKPIPAVTPHDESFHARFDALVKALK